LRILGAGDMRGPNPEAPVGDNHSGHRRNSDPHSFGFAVWQLRDGEDKLIAERLVEIFSAARKV